jgi:threonine/homoserine/homoserine lactone efflux protein
VVAAFGCTLGIVPHMAAAIMGLAALLHTSALAFQTLKYLGVAYLLYMAWNALRERGALRVEPEVGAGSAIQVTTTAILINITDPGQFGIVVFGPALGGDQMPCVNYIDATSSRCSAAQRSRGRSRCARSKRRCR